MNVYTHVAVSDLHDDVESLPGLPGHGSAMPMKSAEPAAMAVSATPVVPTAVPAELAGLISSWTDLPDNVRFAIAALVAR